MVALFAHLSGLVGNKNTVVGYNISAIPVGIAPKTTPERVTLKNDRQVAWARCVARYFRDRW
jgi:hypothetical protein